MQDSGRNDASPSADPAATQASAGSGGRRVFHSVLELIELQARLAGLKILAALQASFLRIGLFFLAVITALAGVIFLYIAIFQFLDRIIPTRDVFVLFALFHFLLAGGLWLAASRVTDAGASTMPHHDKPTGGGAGL